MYYLNINCDVVNKIIQSKFFYIGESEGVNTTTFALVVLVWVEVGGGGGLGFFRTLGQEKKSSIV